MPPERPVSNTESVSSNSCPVVTNKTPHVTVKNKRANKVHFDLDILLSKASGMHVPFGLDWTLDKLRTAKNSLKIASLNVWTHPRRQNEVTDDLVKNLVSMDDQDARLVLQELRVRRRYTFCHSTTQLLVPVEIGPKDRRLPLQALVDSRCEGSCINWRTVEDQNIPTRKFPVPIPVYKSTLCALNQTAHSSHTVLL
jgi:hypothetical protein